MRITIFFFKTTRILTIKKASECSSFTGLVLSCNKHIQKFVRLFFTSPQIHFAEQSERVSKESLTNKVVTQCSSSDVIAKLVKEPILKKIDINKIEDRYCLCLNSGISNQLLLTNKWLLTLSCPELEKTLSAASQFGKINEYSLLLLQLDKKAQYMLMMKGGSGVDIAERCLLLCRLLELSRTECQKALQKHSRLLLRDPQQLSSLVALLVSSGITLKQIKCDLAVLRYSYNFIHDKLEKIRAMGLKDIPVWLVKKSENSFNEYISQQNLRKQAMHEIMGNNKDVVDYLSERLGCNRAEVEMMAVKDHTLLPTNIIKLKQIIDWLFEKGFEPRQIMCQPRVLSHSLKRIEVRYRTLVQSKLSVNNISLFYIPTKDFNKTLLKKRKRLKCIGS